jgi:hypothetical protein
MDLWAHTLWLVVCRAAIVVGAYILESDHAVSVTLVRYLDDRSVSGSVSAACRTHVSRRVVANHPSSLLLRLLWRTGHADPANAFSHDYS